MEAVKAAVVSTSKRFGRLDILVSNAAMFRVGLIDDFSLEDIDQMLAINVKSLFVAIQESLRFMGKGARIINIGSVSRAKFRLGARHWATLSPRGPPCYSRVHCDIFVIASMKVQDVLTSPPCNCTPLDPAPPDRPRRRKLVLAASYKRRRLTVVAPPCPLDPTLFA